MLAPEIIAKTGWTTQDLLHKMQSMFFLNRYNIITVLIGVNNQYQGLDITIYEKNLKTILKKAISLAGNQAASVYMLSVPDWGITPFAEGRNRQQIAFEIDQYNKINRELADSAGTHYIDITRFHRENANDESLLTNDKLHPSAKEYKRWATLVVKAILKQVQ